MKPIEEEFIQKFFGQIGKIKQIFIGKYKNQACNKRKRRTIYYAIIVYKKTEDAQTIIQGDSKILQNIVNKTMKKSLKWVDFEGDDKDEKPLEETPEDAHRRKMEEGGFTLVEDREDNRNTKKHKVSDGYITTMRGITQDQISKIYKNHLKKGITIAGLDSDEEEAERARILKEERKENSEGISNEYNYGNLGKLWGIQATKEKQIKKADKSMYGFHVKDEKKRELQKLQEDFETCKRRLAKKMEKDKNRSKQLLGQ